MGRERFLTYSFGIWREHALLAGRWTDWEPEYDKDVERIDVNNQEDLELLLENTHKVLFDKIGLTLTLYQRQRLYTILVVLRSVYGKNESEVIDRSRRTTSPAYFLTMCQDRDKVAYKDGEWHFGRDMLISTSDNKTTPREAFRAAREKLNLTATDEDFSLWLRS